MTVTSVKIVPVNVPLRAPIRWAWGVRTGVTRNVVLVSTGEGVEGIGETMGGEAIRNLLEALGGKLIGRRPEDLESILESFELVPYFHGYNGYAAVGGLEMALWDIRGKMANRPVSDLIGGTYRKRVQFSAYVFMRYGQEGVGDADSIGDVVDWCGSQVAKSGFSVLKVKGGVCDPEDDIELCQALRARFGSEVALRLDPNGVWSPESTVRLRSKLADLDLEYLEDPTWGMSSMARVRRDLGIPFATNMCVVEAEHVATAYELAAVDVILGDVHKWGGILATKNLASVCRTLGLGFGLHSGCELGISTAAYLHTAASTPNLSYAVDTHYMHLADDIIQGGMLAFEGGSIDVPSGVGLGVDIDEDKLSEYAERHMREGDLGSVGDPFREGFVPRKQRW